MTVPEATALLRLSRSTLYRHVASGLIPSSRIGRRVLLHVDTVCALAPAAVTR